MTKPTPEWLSSWVASIIDTADFSVKNIPFSDSKEWIFRDGAMEHVTRRFFRIVGVAWENEKKETCYQPLIEQKEIGTLGFILRDNDGEKEILVQAKIEPGNVNIAQLSPTCQATASNFLRVHGGKVPPFSDAFAKGEMEVLSETLQSEQGSRFLGKFNRNICAMLEVHAHPDLDITHRFIPVVEFLSLLGSDYLVNTDARSVLVCCPWEKLVDRAPFSRFDSPLARELSISALYKYDREALEGKLNHIIEKRNQEQQIRVVPLGKLHGWNITDDGIHTGNGEKFSVRQIEVETKYREVEHWDQPILFSVSEGKITLICGRKNGVLYFLFRLRKEPGFEHFYELGPTIVMEPGSYVGDEKRYVGTVIAECHQSEEGGRFFQDKNHYQIIDIGDMNESEGDYWLTLSEVAELLKRGKWLTNEARSVLSLLLRWL